MNININCNLSCSGSILQLCLQSRSEHYNLFQTGLGLPDCYCCAGSGRPESVTGSDCTTETPQQYSNRPLTAPPADRRNYTRRWVGVSCQLSAISAVNVTVAVNDSLLPDEHPLSSCLGSMEFLNLSFANA